MFGQQMLARFIFLFSVWLTGLLPYAYDGLLASYILNIRIFQILGQAFIILFGSYMVQRTLHELIPKFREMLKLDDLLFLRFSDKVERYSYSFMPCLFIALGFIFLASDVPNQFQQVLSEGFKAHVIWTLSFNCFFYLLVGTAFWMFASIWLTIFLISRQPLNVDLSPKTTEKFRELSMLALWFSLFYFLAISISMVIPYTPLSLYKIIMSPYVFFIAIGITGILLPFYNIHLALLKMKKQELERIEEESTRLLRQLDDLFVRQPTSQRSDQTIAKMAHLFSLQIKERRMKAAKEWPIDVGFLSKLVGLAIAARVIIDIFTRYLST